MIAGSLGPVSGSATGFSRGAGVFAFGSDGGAGGAVVVVVDVPGAAGLAAAWRALLADGAVVVGAGFEATAVVGAGFGAMVLIGAGFGAIVPAVAGAGLAPGLTVVVVLVFGGAPKAVPETASKEVTREHATPIMMIFRTERLWRACFPDKQSPTRSTGCSRRLISAITPICYTRLQPAGNLIVS